MLEHQNLSSVQVYEMSVSSKRKKLWIDPTIQGALARRVVLHWLVIILLTLVITTLVQFFSDPNKAFTEHLAQVWQQQRIFLVVVAVLLPAFVLDTIKLSNRFVGPITRLRAVFSDIAAGKKAERLNFRGKDFWAGLATDFNRLVDAGHFSQGQNDEEKIQHDERELESTV